MKLHRIAAASAIVLAASLAPVLAAVSPLDLVQPIADYKIYVQDKIDTLEARTKDFTDAVKAGDLAKAKALYAPARVNYEMIEPIAELFSDLDGAIDSRADDHEQKEKSADFTGFHRIEYGLFSQNSTEGLAPIADKLYADVVDLKKRVAGLTVPPEKAIDGAAGLLAGIGMIAIPGIGPVVAAGWLASTAAGAVAGGAAGGLIGAFTSSGHSEEDANYYAETVRRGGTVVSVRTADENVPAVEAILDGATPIDRDARLAEYRSGGWTRFDETAAPYRPPVL